MVKIELTAREGGRDKHWCFVDLPNRVHEGVIQLAKRDGMSYEDVIRRALEEQIGREARASKAAKFGPYFRCAIGGNEAARKARMAAK